MVDRPENNAVFLCHLQFPEGAREYYEPVVLGTLVFPAEYLGKIIKLCEVSFSLIFCTNMIPYLFIGS